MSRPIYLYAPEPHIRPFPVTLSPGPPPPRLQQYNVGCVHTHLHHPGQTLTSEMFLSLRAGSSDMRVVALLRAAWINKKRSIGYKDKALTKDQS